jgi:probable rRNA maturation factor
MSDPQIDLEIQYHVDGLDDDSPRFYQAAVWAANQFGLLSLSASIAIVDDSTIHELNRKHLGHDWPTDAISFVFSSTDRRVEGEVIVSSETAERLCGRAGWRHADEILLYVIHGLLHLVGLDDADQVQQESMRRYEQACLQALQVSGADEHIRRWDDVTY